MIGTTLGSYRIERELGRGGMGAVYVGTHALLGRTAAVKVLLAKYSQDQDVVQRFFNEARAATAIKHPGIVEIFDFGYATDAAGCAYIVMELCDGESLTSRLHRRTLSIASALTIARHIASALAAAHRASIVHRDLKPDNVFVVPDPDVAGGERIKLLDFGIAKLATGSAGLAKTSTGAIMGTPYYMSPEQCRGAGQVDHRSDLYSLGCILFEMVCGRVPFVGEGAGDIISSHMLVPPPAPSLLAPQVPAEVEQLILRLLAKKPADRPESADAVSEELSRLEATISPTLTSAERVQHGVAATLPSDRGVDGMAETAASTPPARKEIVFDPTQLDVAATTTLSSTAAEATAPVARRRGVALIASGVAAAGVVVAVSIAVRSRSDGSTKPAAVQRDAAVTSDVAPVVADTRPRLIIGPLGGDELTDAMRERIRPAMVRHVDTLAPDLRGIVAVDPADSSPAMVLDGNLVKLASEAGKIKCTFKLMLLTHPDKSIVAALTGSASVELTSTSLKEIDLAAADCVDAVVENLFQTKIVPTVREKLGTRASTSVDKPSDEGAPTTETIRETVRAHVVRVQECYEAALVRKPNTGEAKLQTRFTIGIDGRVTGEAVEGTPDRAFAACVKEVLRTMAFFPPPASPIPVNYPFSFRPAE